MRIEARGVKYFKWHDSSLPVPEVPVSACYSNYIWEKGTEKAVSGMTHCSLGQLQ